MSQPSQRQENPQLHFVDSEVEQDSYIRAPLAGHSVDVNQNEYRQGRLVALRRSMDKLGEHLQ